MHNCKRYFLSLMLVCSLILPTPIRAQSFDFIVSDADMNDTHAMTKELLHSFLLEKGALGHLRLPDTDGITKPASEIIYRVSQQYGLNPKFLLALLQREQSLVEDPTPSQNQLDWAVGYGVCDSCEKNDPRLAAYKGFANQLQYAAARLRTMYESGIGFQIGMRAIIDGVEVIPETRATAALYSYTPHLHGNNNFRDIWSRYFLMRYPDGTLLQPRGEQGVYLIQYGRKRPFASKSALVSRYDIDNVIQVAKSELEAYEAGSPIKFPNYSLFLSSLGATYLLVDDTLRSIDPETFRSIGFNQDELIDVDATELAGYEIGKPLDAEHPTVADELIQAPNGAVFALRDGVRHPIVAPEILRDQYADARPKKLSANVLAEIPQGNAILFRSGSLVKAKNNPSVYLISNGVRRPFLSENAFRSYGFEFRDVITTTKAAVELHPLGIPVDALPPTTTLASR